MSKETEKTEVEKAQELIQAEEARKQQAFIEEVNAVCQKHGYSLQPQATFNVVPIK